MTGYDGGFGRDPENWDRLGAVWVSGELLRDGFFVESRPDRWFRVGKGIPADAEFVRMFIDPPTDTLVLIYRHPSFPKTAPGCQVVCIDPPQLMGTQVTAEELAHLEDRRREAARGDLPLVVEAAPDAR